MKQTRARKRRLTVTITTVVVFLIVFVPDRALELLSVLL